MVVIPRGITKLLPSRQIVYSTQQVVYLVLKNMYRELKGYAYFNLEFQLSSYIIKLVILY